MILPVHRRHLLFTSVISVFLLITFFLHPKHLNSETRVTYNKLDNGINVIFNYDTSSALTAIQIWVSAGGADENKNILGISHFIEHVIFKGTKNRSREQIAPEIEKLGGVINAATSKDFTYFYTIVPSKYCIKAAEILSDAVLNPEFPAEEMENERFVVLEEIQRSDDDPHSQLFEEFYQQVYRDSPYTQRVLGTKEVVSNLKRDDLLAFHKKFYIPENIFVVISGNFRRKEVLDFLENSFGKLSKTTAIPDAPKITISEKPLKTSKKIIKRDVAHSYILIGFPAADIKSRDQYSLDLTAYILGNGLASRLYRKFVEETNLAYGISCSFATHRGPGLFYVYASCKPENVSSLLNKILVELVDITLTHVTEEELKRAKALLIRDKLLETHTPDGKAGELGFYAAVGNKKIPMKYIKNINKLKPADIKKVFSKYLVFPNIPTVIMMPEKSSK
ncbi:MAG: insulinase family protein [Elusimicrobia bacterium]|nr:insulinase family protein [Elusimicrobiota bacterium]